MSCDKYIFPQSAHMGSPASWYIKDTLQANSETLLDEIDKFSPLVNHIDLVNQPDLLHRLDWPKKLPKNEATRLAEAWRSLAEKCSCLNWFAELFQRVHIRSFWETQIRTILYSVYCYQTPMKLTTEVDDEPVDTIDDATIETLHPSHLLSVAMILDVRKHRTTVTSDAQTYCTQNRFALTVNLQLYRPTHHKLFFFITLVNIWNSMIQYLITSYCSYMCWQVTTHGVGKATDRGSYRRFTEWSNDVTTMHQSLTSISLNCWLESTMMSPTIMNQ
jgi:hypothetical protein